jgi:hypothetical protein
MLRSILQYTKSKGDSIAEVPIIDDKILDIAALLWKIAEKGGCPDSGTTPGFWSGICFAMGIGENHLSILEAFYMKYIFTYERELRLIKKKQRASRLLASQQTSGQNDQTNLSSIISTNNSSIPTLSGLSNISVPTTTAILQQPQQQQMQQRQLQPTTR